MRIVAGKQAQPLSTIRHWLPLCVAMSKWPEGNYIPANTQRYKYIIITTKRRFDVIVTCSLHCMFGGYLISIICTRNTAPSFNSYLSPWTNLTRIYKPNLPGELAKRCEIPFRTGAMQYVSCNHGAGDKTYQQNSIIDSSKGRSYMSRGAKP